MGRTPGPTGPQDAPPEGIPQAAHIPTGPTGAALADELGELEERSRALGDWRRYAIPLAAYAAALAGCGTGIALGAAHVGAISYSPNWAEIALFLCSIAAAALLVGGGLFAHARIQLLARTRARIGAIARTMPQAPAGDATSAYFTELVQINIKNLSAYYRLVQLQTDRSYKASLLVAVVGFVLVAAGLVVGVLAPAPGVLTIGYVSVGAGILGEFTASVFFYLYSKTVRQLKEYHESLVHVQNVLLALKLASDIQTPTERLALTREVVGAVLTHREQGADVT